MTNAYFVMPRRAGILAAVSAMLFATTAWAQKQTPPAGGTPKNFVLPAKRSFTLPNGMGVTLIPYGEVPKVSIELSILTGNVNEGPEEIWLADLVGDLMQEGTTTKTAEQIAQAAARMGGALNFGVTADETNVGGDVLAEFGPEMVALIADVVRNPKWPASELDRLKANRLRQLSIVKSQPQALAQEKFSAVMYPNHPYGRIFPTEKMIQSYTVDQIQRFYNANFGGRRSHLYVAGRFDGAAIERAVRAAFGDWSAGAPAVPNIATGKSGRALYVIDRPKAVQSTIYLGLPLADPTSRDWEAIRVTNALLGGSFGSRITTNIRENKGYTYSPFSQLTSHPKSAYWVQQADVTTNVTGPSLKEIFFEIDRMRKEPVSAAELKGIQNYLAGIFVLQNSTRQGIIDQLEFLRLHGLPDEFLTRRVANVFAVTPADVQRIMQTYLDPAKMPIVVVGDEKVIADQIKPYQTVTP
jgi:zinc protease